MGDLSVGYSIRLFEKEDYSKIISLWDRVGLPYKPKGRDGRENMIKEMKFKPTALFIVTSKDQVIGTVLASHDGRKGWINRLAVELSWQRKGLAQKLIKKAEEFLKAQDIKIIACLIEDYNTSSINLFLKCGYKEFNGMHYLTKREHDQI